MAVIHEAAKVDVRQIGGHNSVIYTWGLPTTPSQFSQVVGSVLGGTQGQPGNRTGNTPQFQQTGWTALGPGDTCIPEFLPGAQDRCVQITGTAGGATINIVGSNDGVNFYALTSDEDTALTGLTPGVIYNILEKCAWIGVLINGGTPGTTALNVIMSTRQPS